MHIERGLRGNRLAVRGRREELVQWHVVDEGRRRRRGDMQPVWRWRESVVHNRHEEVVRLSHWLLLLLADWDHPDAHYALFVLADGGRAAVVVERNLFAGCVCKDNCFVVPLEEASMGWMLSDSVSCPATLAMCEHSSRSASMAIMRR